MGSLNSPVPFHLAIPRVAYESINDVVVNSFGKSLPALAEEDPIRTFSLLRHFMIEGFSTPPDALVTYQFSNGKSINSEEDGDAAAMATRTALENINPIVIEPIDVMISIITNEVANEEGGPILRFLVEPPSLAF